MPPFLAHTADTGKWMFVAGLALAFFFGLWLWVIAARRNVVWLLALILFPLAALIFMFAEPKALRPSLFYICSFVLAFWGFEGIDGRSYLSLESRVELFAQEIAGTAPRKVAPKGIPPLKGSP